MRLKPYISYVMVMDHQNSPENIVSFLEKLILLSNTHFENYEILVVNNQQTSNSIQDLKERAKIWKGDIKILHLANHQTNEEAMCIGLENAMGDYIFELESLYIPNEKDILKLFNECQSGYDIVTAKYGTSRNSLSRRLKQFLLNVTLRDYDVLPESDLKVVSRRALNIMLRSPKHYFFRRVNYALIGYSTKHINLTTTEEVTSVPSKFSDIISVAFINLLVFSKIWLRLGLVLLLAPLLIAVILCGYFVYGYVSHSQLIDMNLFLFSLLFLCLAGVVLLLLMILSFYILQNVYRFRAMSQSIYTVEIIKGNQDQKGWKA
ncbi:glycosyltransferase [Neobacillus dielmonensis]|uniref:glycosyltransferase n=1 Tax=Neobacillus dielmonensis TaxID=1347369 RepID=UPI0005A95886|nr:glycosyltransferase [Neobacillus dielmonensis]